MFPKGPPMRIASYRARGRASYGVVVGDGIVDLKLRMSPRYGTLFDLLRGDALNEAKAAIENVRADFPVVEAQLLPPVLTPEKILCIGINYANRNADFNDPEVPQYPSMFYRAPASLVGHGQSL